MNMIVGTRYRVTRDSKHHEFQVGDRIWLEADGSIMCPNAHGWMPPEDVAKATKGWAIELDTTWLDAKRADLEKQLAELSALTSKECV